MELEKVAGIGIFEFKDETIIALNRDNKRYERITITSNNGKKRIEKHEQINSNEYCRTLEKYHINLRDEAKTIILCDDSNPKP